MKLYTIDEKQVNEINDLCKTLLTNLNIIFEQAEYEEVFDADDAQQKFEFFDFGSPLP